MQLKSQLLLVLVAAFLVTFAFSSMPVNGGARDQDSTVATPSDSVVLPKVVERVQPAYPDDAAQRGIEGTIYLFALVDGEGHVVKTTVDTTRTFFSHPGEHKTAKYEAKLTQAALAAVAQWKFKPGTINGEPSAMGVTIPIQFQLANMQSGAQGKPPSFALPTPNNTPPQRDMEEKFRPTKSGEPDKK
jgi:Gram-negative bacterial TonB protein C-terminal